MRPALFRTALVLSLGAFAPSLDAQSCIALPDPQHISALLGLEGSDDLTGESASIFVGGEDVGYQLRGERYDRHSQFGPWYGAEVQLTRELKKNMEPRGRCLTSAIRYHHEKQGDNAHQRARASIGMGFGHSFGPLTSRWTMFAQPLMVVQHERYEGRKRTSLGPGGTIGTSLAIPAYSLVLRSTLHHAGTSHRLLNRRHNWLELTVQAGITFGTSNEDSE